MSSQSLLPDNRTPLETALEKSLAKQLQNIESPYPQLWDPAQVKPTLLPYLAHAKGVPDWGEDTDAAKRDTVANIWTVQRQAGTRQAVKQAVDALGFDAEVKRGEAPYALQVRANMVGFSKYPDVMQRLMDRISASKSERDQTQLDVLVEFDSTLNIASSAYVGKNMVASGDAQGRSMVAINLLVAPVSKVQKLVAKSGQSAGRQSLLLNTQRSAAANIELFQLEGVIS